MIRTRHTSANQFTLNYACGLLNTIYAGRPKRGARTTKLEAALTVLRRENQIKPHQLHLNSNDDEISIPNSSLTSSNFEEDCIISATSRKHLNIFPDFLMIVLMNEVS